MQATLRYIREIPEEDFNAIVDVLNAFDNKNNEMIGHDDLSSVLHSLGKKATNPEIKALMYMVNNAQNDSGLIAFVEVFKILAKWDAWMLERQVDNPKIEISAEFKDALEAFKKLEENGNGGNGRIGWGELQSALESAGKEVTSNEVKYLTNFIEQKNDDDYYGIRFSEFFYALKKLDKDTVPFCPYL